MPSIVTQCRWWAAFEILIYTSALQAVIRAGETSKIASILQTGRQFGMVAMDDYLMGLVQEGKVTMEAAYMKAIDKSRFCGEPGLKR